MTTSNAKKISSLILRLADNPKVDRKVLYNEIYQVVKNLPEDYADEIIQDLEYQDL